VLHHYVTTTSDGPTNLSSRFFLLGLYVLLFRVRALPHFMLESCVYNIISCDSNVICCELSNAV